MEENALLYWRNDINAGETMVPGTFDQVKSARQRLLISVTRERERTPSRHLDKLKEVAMLQATGSA